MGPLTTSDSVSQGNVGAGTGAAVGQRLGITFATKGGLGSASTKLPDGELIGALAVVNSFGDIIDPQTREVIAGTRNPTGDGFLRPNPLGNTISRCHRDRCLTF